MKKIMLLILVTLSFVACSKDDESDIVFSEENIETHQIAFDNAASYLRGNPSVDITTTADYVKTLDGVTDVQITDNAIEVTTKGNVSFVLDFNSYPKSEVVEIDTKKIEQRIDSIENAINLQRASGYEQTSEVFKDYISQNTSSEETPCTSVTRASALQKVRLSRRTVAIWNPWKDFSFETEPIKEVTSYINKEHRLQRFNTFTPASFAYFKDFDVIYLSSHGYRNGEIILPLDCLTNEQIKIYNEELRANRIKLYSDKDHRGILLTKTFFDKYLPDLSNTIIYTSACYLGVKDSHFLSSCLKKDVADYFASDNLCSAKHIIYSFEEFYIFLMHGYSTNKSFTNGRGYFIGSFVFDEKPWTYKYSRYGSKLVYYPKPFATGVGNRNNSTTRSGESSASSIIVNTQLLYSSEESGDILNSIEAGICLQDMETKEVKLIPFSNKNMVSNEKKSHGDVTVSNIAVALDELIDGHKYAYCCYTKVDGQITLSEETYRWACQNYWVDLKYSYTLSTNCYYDGVLQKNEKETGSSYISIRKKDGIFQIESGTGPWPQAYIESLLKENDSAYSRYYIVKNGRYTDDFSNLYQMTFSKKEKGECFLSEDNIRFTGYFEWGIRGTSSTGSCYQKMNLEVNINNLDTKPSLTIYKSLTSEWPNYGDWDKTTNSWHNYKEITNYEYDYEGYTYY